MIPMMDWSIQTSSCWTTNVVMPLLRPPSCPLGSSSGSLVLQAQIAQFPSPAAPQLSALPYPWHQLQGVLSPGHSCCS